MNCPVCPRGDIAPEADACPGCGTDLKPIRRVRDLARNYYNEALSLFQNGFPSAAISKLAAATALDDKFVDAFILHGKILWQNGSLKEAMSGWERASQIDPQNQATRNLISEANRRIAGNKNKKNARIAIASCFCLIAIFLAGYFLFSQTDRRITESLNTLGPKIDSYQNILSSISPQLNLVQEYQQSVKADFESLKATVLKLENDLSSTETRLSESKGSEQKLSRRILVLNKQLQQKSDDAQSKQNNMMEAIRKNEASLAASLADKNHLNKQIATFTVLLENILATLNSLKTEFLLRDIEQLRSDLYWLQNSAHKTADGPFSYSEQTMKSNLEQKIFAVQKTLAQKEKAYGELIRAENSLTDLKNRTAKNLSK